MTLSQCGACDSSSNEFLRFRVKYSSSFRIMTRGMKSLMFYLFMVIATLVTGVEG